MNQKTASRNEFFLLVSLLLIFIIAARTPIDSDLWWHLRTGEATVTSQAPVTHDIFSYTRQSEAWTNHSWLSQVVLYSGFQTGNYLLLGLIISILALASMYFVYKQMGGVGLSKAFLLTAGGIVASVVWVPRPQMFSFFLLALLTFIVDKYADQTKKLIFFLSPVFILWSNLHGGYFLGVIFLCCMAASMVIDKVFSISKNKQNWRSIGGFGIVIIISYLVTAINPNGISTWLIPFKTIGVSGLQNLISEWASPDFHQPVQQLFLFYFFLVFGVFALSNKKIKTQELIVVSCFGILAFVARRNFGPFVIISLPILSKYFDDVLMSIVKGNAFLNGLIEKSNKNLGKTNPTRANQYLNAVVLFILGFSGVMKLYIVTQPDLVDQYISSFYPQKAVEFIVSNAPDGEMINEYDWGGYLIWTMRSYPVFIDGRTDLYGDAILNEWLAVVQCDKNWRDIVDKWTINILFIKPGRPIITCAQVEGWEMVYSDELSVVLTRNKYAYP